MSMIEVKTADLSGRALDYAVANCLNGDPAFFDAFGARMLGRRISLEVMAGNVRPSTDWAQCGPMIVSRMVAIDYGRPLRDGELPKWVAQCWMPYGCGEGETPLIAACRAIVAAKLGDTVQVPAELVEVVQ